jgi:hypothetical protein
LVLSVCNRPAEPNWDAATSAGVILKVMPERTTPRLMRYGLVETIVPLAASADALVDYVHADRSDIDDAVSDFVDWTYESAPGLIKAGVLPDDLAPALRLLRNQALAAARSAPEEECETAVLRPEWSALRTTANAILDRFRALGVPVPSIKSGLLRDLTTVPRSEW